MMVSFLGENCEDGEFLGENFVDGESFRGEL